MASYKLEFANSVRKDFKNIQKKDAERILARIDSLTEDPRPAGCVKLTGEEIYRIRVGSYRVLYKIEDAILLIVIIKIGHRRDVYS